MRTDSFISSRRCGMSFLFSALLLCTALTPVSAQEAWTPRADGFPQTAFEASGYEANTNHLEMWAYLEALEGCVHGHAPGYLWEDLGGKGTTLCGIQQTAGE